MEISLQDLTRPTERRLPGGWARLSFDVSLMSEEDLEKLFEAQQILNEIGIHFDSGTGGGRRDWELDWSLTGAIIEVRPFRCMQCEHLPLDFPLFVHWQSPGFAIYTYTYCDQSCLERARPGYEKSGWSVLTIETGRTA